MWKRKRAGQRKEYKNQMKGLHTMQLLELDAVTEQRGNKQDMIEIGISSVVGTRKNQQDSVFGYQSGSCAIAIVCDGIGGLSGGEIASRVAVESLADMWFEQMDFSDIPAFLKKAAHKADRDVFMQKDETGSPLRAGTTVVAAVVRGSELYWLSVGDSRIYVIRGNKIRMLNITHNYRLMLDMQLQQGRMTQEEYAAEEYRAEALISYIGMGKVRLMDISSQAYHLMDRDIVLLSSDGLYRGLRDQEILEIVRQNEQDVKKAAYMLTAAVAGRKRQDNTSVIILRYMMENEI